MRRRLGLLVGVAALAALALFGRGPSTESPAMEPVHSLVTDPSWTDPQPLSLSVTADDAVSRAIGAGLGCDGGRIDERHLYVERDFDAGVFSALPGLVNANMGITGPIVSRQDEGTHRLEPDNSHVTLSNERGTLRMRLGGGHCPAANLTGSAGGTVVDGSGPLTVVRGTGAYRDATLDDGTWDLGIEINPGADDAWSLGLDGHVAVLEPSFAFNTVDSYWGNLGADYALRLLTVELRLENYGPGDAYGVELVDIDPGDEDVAFVSPLPHPLGDLEAGEEERIVVQFQLGTPGPCDLVVADCDFRVVGTAVVPDALDVPRTLTARARIPVPDAPPPAED